MTPETETWIVVVDGMGARVFEERQRLGPLVERQDLAVRSREDRHRAHGGATVHGRFGTGRSAAGSADPAADAEVRFLKAVAKRIDAAAEREVFGHLVVMAPPTALGTLRAALGPSATRRLELCDPHERMGEDAETLRGRLRAARAAA